MSGDKLKQEAISSGSVALRIFRLFSVLTLSILLAITPVLADSRPLIESSKNLPDNHTSAIELAKAIVPEYFHYCLVSAEFEGNDVQNEIFKESLQGFPTEGSSYIVLSTGKASDASGTAEEFVSTAVEDGIYIPSGSPDGYDAYDVATLKIKLKVPEFADYLTFQYKFGTEENPTWVGTEFQDFFRAIVVTPDGQEHVLTSLTVDSAAEISNKVTGDSINPQPPFPEPNDVTYNAMTKLLTAKFDVREWRGENITVVFQIGDASDPIYDSAVFLDNLSFLPLAIQSPDWPMLCHDERNTRLSGSKLPNEVNLDYIKPIKTIGIPTAIAHPPIVVGDKVIIVVESIAPKDLTILLASLAWLKLEGVLKGLSNLLGKAIDLYDVVSAIIGSPSPTLYTIYCMDADSGDEVWNKTIPASDINIAASQEEVFIVAKGTAIGIRQAPGVYCFDINSGDKKWYHPFITLLANGLILSDDKLFFFDMEPWGSYLHCLDANSGDEIPPYPQKISSAPVGPLAVAYNKVFIATIDNNICCLDVKTGKELWSQKIEGELKTYPVVSGDKVYVGAFSWPDYSILSIDVNTRDIDVIWKGDLRPTPVISATNDVLVYHGYGLELVKSGKQWDLPGPGEVKTVIASIDNKALILTTYDELICLDLNSLGVIWEINLNNYIPHDSIEEAKPILANENIFIALKTQNGFALAKFSEGPSINMKLTIELSTDKAHEGDIIKISGRLTYEDGTPIPNALIKIFDDDGYSELTAPPDDFIAEAKTDEEGYYEVEWIAKNTDGWLHKKVDLYSKFEGPPSYIESDTVHIEIEPKPIEHKVETIKVKEECVTEIKGENFELMLYTLPSEGKLEVNVYKDIYVETPVPGKSDTGIGLSVNLAGLSIKNAVIKLYYTDEEVKEFDECSLKLYKWDESLGEWIELPGGVNPEENYVWAEVTSFSDFAVFGNKKPVAFFDFSPTEPNVNDAVTFTSLSYDPDGTIVKYIWDFGDGSKETTTVPTVTHAYSSEGVYTVMLTVVDNDGASTTVSKPIEVKSVQAPPPQVPPPFAWLIQLWKELVNVSGSVSTGELDASWELVDYSDNDIGYGFIDVSISEDGKTVTVTIDNAYPGYEATIDLNIVNTGSIAAKIGKIELSKDEALEITYSQIEGEVIDVGQKISVPVKVKVNDLAEEKSSYSFSLTFEVRQFNK